MNVFWIKKNPPSQGGYITLGRVVGIARFFQIFWLGKGWNSQQLTIYCEYREDSLLKVLVALHTHPFFLVVSLNHPFFIRNLFEMYLG